MDFRVVSLGVCLFFGLLTSRGDAGILSAAAAHLTPAITDVTEHAIEDPLLSLSCKLGTTFDISVRATLDTQDGKHGFRVFLETAESRTESDNNVHPRYTSLIRYIPSRQVAKLETTAPPAKDAMVDSSRAIVKGKLELDFIPLETFNADVKSTSRADSALVFPSGNSFVKIDSRIEFQKGKFLKGDLIVSEGTLSPPKHNEVCKKGETWSPIPPDATIISSSSDLIGYLNQIQGEAASGKRTTLERPVRFTSSITSEEYQNAKHVFYAIRSKHSSDVRTVDQIPMSYNDRHDLTRLLMVEQGRREVLEALERIEQSESTRPPVITSAERTWEELRKNGYFEAQLKKAENDQTRRLRKVSFAIVEDVMYSGKVPVFSSYYFDPVQEAKIAEALRSHDHAKYLKEIEKRNSECTKKLGALSVFLEGQFVNEVPPGIDAKAWRQWTAAARKGVALTSAECAQNYVPHEFDESEYKASLEYRYRAIPIAQGVNHLFGKSRLIEGRGRLNYLQQIIPKAQQDHLSGKNTTLYPFLDQERHALLKDLEPALAMETEEERVVVAKQYAHLQGMDLAKERGRLQAERERREREAKENASPFASYRLEDEGGRTVKGTVLAENAYVAQLAASVINGFLNKNAPKGGGVQFTVDSITLAPHGDDMISLSFSIDNVPIMPPAPLLISKAALMSEDGVLFKHDYKSKDGEIPISGMSAKGEGSMKIRFHSNTGNLEIDQVRGGGSVSYLGSVSTRLQPLPRILGIRRREGDER